MLDNSMFLKMLHDWSSVVSSPTKSTCARPLEENNPKLSALLSTGNLTLKVLDKISIDILGSMNEDILWLTDNEILWMLPVLLKHSLDNEEPLFATAAIWSLEKTLSISPEWPEIKNTLQPDTINCINDLAQACCHLGWDDERRIEKHGKACRKILVAGSPDIFPH